MTRWPHVPRITSEKACKYDLSFGITSVWWISWIIRDVTWSMKILIQRLTRIMGKGYIVAVLRGHTLSKLDSNQKLTMISGGGTFCLVRTNKATIYTLTRRPHSCDFLISRPGTWADVNSVGYQLHWPLGVPVYLWAPPTTVSHWCVLYRSV